MAIKDFQDNFFVDPAGHKFTLPTNLGTRNQNDIPEYICSLLRRDLLISGTNVVSIPRKDVKHTQVVLLKPC